jgi:hypothetical protein
MIATGRAEACTVLATVKDALRRASARWPFGPSLTAAARDAATVLGRDGETPFSRTEKHHSKKWPLNLLNLTHTTWEGRITDPRDGKTYQAKLWVDATGNLHLRGFIGIPLLGSTQIWQKYNGSLTAECGLARKQQPAGNQPESGARG